MATPTLKLLLNALRLGQPQDPQAAIFALAEAIVAQEDVIDDLRRRVQLAQSAAQILEIKASRLEQELEALRRGDASPREAPSSPLSQAPVHGPPPQSLSTPRSSHAAPTAAAAPSSERTPMSQPFSQPFRPPSAFPPPMSAPRVPAGIEAPEPTPGEDPSDDFKVSTVVVHKRDVERLMSAEAPFRIAPAGHRVPERGSIPGAPWARNRGPDSFRPPVMDEFTVDAHHDDLDDGDDDDNETYQDKGGTNALATALGLSPNDPRVEKLRGIREDESDETPSSTRSRPPPRR